MQRLAPALASMQFDRARPLRTVKALIRWALHHPQVLLPGVHWLAGLAWRMKQDLARSRGEVRKLSFFIHNFMDACNLEQERVDACAFMVATVDGPLSMCVHNAKRDDYLLKPIAVGAGEKMRFWSPVSGEFEGAMPAPQSVAHSRKTARGRAKVELDAARAAKQAVAA